MYISKITLENEYDVINRKIMCLWKIIKVFEQNMIRKIVRCKMNIRRILVIEK